MLPPDTRLDLRYQANASSIVESKQEEEFLLLARCPKATIGIPVEHRNSVVSTVMIRQGTVTGYIEVLMQPVTLSHCFFDITKTYHPFKLLHHYNPKLELDRNVCTNVRQAVFVRILLIIEQLQGPQPIQNIN